MIVLNEKSAQKRIQYLRNLNEYKEKLMDTISHNLRTPLNGIIGMISIVMERVTDTEKKKMLKIALKSANLLLYIVHDILDFCELQKGMLQLEISSTNLAEILQEMKSLIGFQAKRKNLNFSIVNDLPLQESIILTDPKRLKQILVNLLTNALKFTSFGILEK